MPDDKTTQEPNAEGKDDGKTPPADFTAWLAGQPEDVQSLYEQHTAGLKSALKSERQRNADLAAELRDAAGKATGEAKAELDALATRAEEESRRGDFYEAAHSAGYQPAAGLSRGPRDRRLRQARQAGHRSREEQVP